MRLAAAAAILTLCLVGCQKRWSVYHKGAPTRVTVERQPSATPYIVALIDRLSDDRVQLRILRLHEVRLERKVQYSELEERHEHPGHPLFELLEVPVGLWVLLTGPATIIRTYGAMDDDRTPDRRLERDTPMFRAFLNPFQSWMGARVRTYVGTGDRFTPPPTIRQHNVSLPVSEQTVRYRVLDSTRAVIASGTLTTDLFGKAELDGVPLEAVGIELSGPELSTIAPIRVSQPGQARSPAPKTPR